MSHKKQLIFRLKITVYNFLGLVVFGTVGFIADKKGMEIDKVVDAGPGLAFIVYPEAVSAMAVSPLFSFMFFFMLVLLAISRFTLISTLWILFNFLAADTFIKFYFDNFSVSESLKALMIS